MKSLGKPLAIIGALLLLYAFSMDTTVSSGYGRVHNIGLMSSQQNYLLLGALLTLVGIGMALSKSKEGQETNQGLIACPFCAELIKREAKICKHCKSQVDSHGEQIEPTPEPSSDGENSRSATEKSAIPKKAWKRSMLNTSCKVEFDSVADRATIKRVVAEEISKVEKKFNSRDLILTFQDEVTAEVLINETAPNVWKIELNFSQEKHLLAFFLLGGLCVYAIATESPRFLALVVAAFVLRLIFTGNLTERRADRILTSIKNRLKSNH